VKKFKILAISIVLIGLTFFAYTKASRFLRIDSCLDNGGSWDYSQEKCNCADSFKKSDLLQLGKKSSLVIRNRCAVLYYPNKLKISQSKNVNETDFYTSADDAMYYIAQSRTFFKKNQIQIIETESQIIDFKTGGTLIKTINLDASELWGILFFDGKNIPIKINMTNTESEVNRFLK
jgi:hypothetical protein